MSHHHHHQSTLATAALLLLAACTSSIDLGTLDFSGPKESVSPGSLNGTYTVSLTRGSGSPPLACSVVTLTLNGGSGSWSGCTTGGTAGAAVVQGGSLILRWSTGETAISFDGFYRQSGWVNAQFEGPRTAAGAGPPGLGSAWFAPARQ